MAIIERKAEDREERGKWREREREGEGDRRGANSLLVDLRSIESVSHHTPTGIST